MTYHPMARTLAVLELLQAYGQMSGPELAARLEVETRTIRRYVVRLQEMGIPIEAEPGRFGGYALRPGYKLPPLMFNDDEVLLLAVGLELAKRAGLADTGAAAESALAKINRVLPLALRDRMQALGAALDIDPAPQDELPPVEKEVIASLSIASGANQQTQMDYQSGEGITRRIFDPYKVLWHQGRWYTIGYCHLRGGLRVFRLDRVKAVMVLDSTFTPPPDFDALDYLLNSFESIPDRWQIDVLLDLPLDEARRRIPRALAALASEGEQTRLRASMPDLDEMARTLVAIGCPLKIITPDELRTAFLRLADAIRRDATRS
jgi:predicted DNA-binding transcriptional regulator YafY